MFENPVENGIFFKKKLTGANSFSVGSLLAKSLNVNPDEMGKGLPGSSNGPPIKLKGRHRLFLRPLKNIDIASELL